MMLLFSLAGLAYYFPLINIKFCVSLRALAGLFSVLITSLLAGNTAVSFARKWFSSPVRQYTPQAHQGKNGTPTMGGIFVVGIVTLATLVWSEMTDLHIPLILSGLLLFGAIGIYDDTLKIQGKKNLPPRTKFLLQTITALIIVCLWQSWHEIPSTIIIPFYSEMHITLPLWLITLWRVFIIVGTSNAVNLTDGLDGLALGSLIPNFITFGIIAYLARQADCATYLHMPFTNTAEVATICAHLVGASVGLLWFNAYPAQIFMGDVGSLALGATLGIVALMTRQELLLALSGMLFIAETISVIIQVTSFKLFKKRVFLMAPLHHHYELLGVPETKIVTRFNIITSLLCLLALACFTIFYISHGISS